MIHRLVLLLASVAIVTLSLGGESHAAKKKRSSAQMDGAILVVSALDGPMPTRPRGRVSYRGAGVLKSMDGGRIWTLRKRRGAYAAPLPRHGRWVAPTPRLSPAQLQWAPRM